MKMNLWFIAGLMSAFAFGAVANIPNGSMAITPEVSEIRAQRQADLTFDQDLKRLSAIQGRYRENLPLKKMQVKAPKKIAAHTKHAPLKAKALKSKTKRL